MSWRDRIKVASYTGPSGKKFEFDWDEAELSFDHKSSVFRFPDKDGAEVISLGTGEKRYPLTAFVSGDDYDISAQEFLDILAEKGNGILVHPIYGRKTVQPTNIKRTDKPVSEGNMATISVLYIESVEILAEETQEDLEDNISKLFEEQDVVLPIEFSEQKRVDSVQDLSNSESRFSTNLSIMDRILAPIAALNDEVNGFFTAVSLSLNNNLTDLVGKPLTLASQTIALIKAPARIFQSLQLRLEGYKELALALRLNASNPNVNNDSRNTALEVRFQLSAVTAAFAETLLIEEFKTKSAALLAALDLQEFHTLNMEFIESQESKFQDTTLNLLLYGDSENCHIMNQIVELTANILARKSFNLQQERIIELSRARNIVELTYELYGTADNETIDLLISSNKIIGDEIILIPKGREIVYYV